MKSFIFISALVFSAQVFSQSMIVLNNGKILSITDQGTLNDYGNFITPYTISSFGGRFLIEKDRKVKTVDASGVVYDKDEKAPRKISHLGDNYFISQLGKIFTIDEKGYLFKNKREKAFRKVLHKGANFVVSSTKKKQTLYTINQLGTVLETNVPDLDLAQIDVVGGQYFTTTDGTLYTVSNEGFVYSKKDIGNFKGLRSTKGSNYFFFNDSLYTISQSGLLTTAGTMRDFGTIKILGTNFFMNFEGSVFTINSSGMVNSTKVDFKFSDISQFSHL